MHQSNSTGALITLLELAVPFYGLRLTRRFGTTQIGWALVVSFAILALMRLAGLEFGGLRPDWDLTWTLICVVVPVLLLIGMAHMETVFKERCRAERAVKSETSVARSSEMPELLSNREVMARVAVAAAQHFNRHLGVITLYANLLRRKNFDPRTAEHHRRIAEEAAKAAALGKRLLSTGATVSAPKSRVNITRLLAELGVALQHSLGSRVILENQCRELLPPLPGDAAQLRFILEQLVRNAAEASPAGGKVCFTAGLVRVDARSVPSKEAFGPGRFLRLSVSDSGCGMSDEVKGHLFEPFYTTKDSARHEGLGLASVYGMVKDRGGWVRVQSAPGTGTNVEVFLPLAV